MLDGVDEALWAAYNEDPSNYDLLGVLADAYDEAGRPDVAEPLRWLWAKRRVPTKRTFGHYGWSEDSPGVGGECNVLPRWFKDYYMPKWENGDGARRATERVVISWSKCTADERQQLWDWQPAEVSV